MMHREFRFNLLLVVLFMGLGLAVALMRGDEQRVYAEAVASDTGALTTPPGAIYLPVVSQGQSSAQEPHTPTATVTTNPSDPATNTPTPTATATVEAPTATPTATSTDVPPPARPGFFALNDWLTYNAATAVDSQGGIHLSFYTSDERHRDEPRNQPAYYTYCPGPTEACAHPENWSALVAMDDSVNEVQIVVTKANQPRMLVRRNGSRGYDYDFWACDEDCTNANNWFGLRVTEAMGVELFNADMPQHSFALDSQDRPRFVYGNGWGNGRPTAMYYARCDAADCTEPGSWDESLMFGPIEGRTITTDYATLLFDGDKPRVITRLNLSGLPVGVYYHACDAGCDNPHSWTETPLAFPADKMWANWDLALDAAGRPRVALYEPPSIDITVGGRLFYAWCDADDCAPTTAWNMTHIASGEGKNVDLAIDAQGRTHMVYDAGQRGVLAHLWCDGGCTEASQWQRRILETSDDLLAEFPPAIPFTCNQETAFAWLDAVPMVTFDAQGKLVVAYDTKHVATCYYRDPGNPDPVITRVERIWWAVRWAYFAQP